VDFYILKPEIQCKITVQELPKNAKSQEITENQKSTEYRNISKMGPSFCIYLVRGEVRTPELLSVTPMLH